MKLTLKMYIIIGVLVFIMIVSLFSGGSPILNLYTPGESVEVEKGEVIPEVKYNADLLSNITSGYRGIPKLVQNDNKVFFIPNEYAGGHLLRNFRIIGVNNSKAVEMKGDSDDIVDYKGAVILYGFQATYKEDYGEDYDFDYEPYDYDFEYELVDPNFESPFVKTTKTKIDDETEDSTGLSTTGKSTFEENPDAIDDSNFKVATVVMQHVIGENKNTILYCDSGSCTVSELGEGKFNLVTNLNDSALTVCYNEELFVYSFDEKNKTYASKERYYYKMQDLFKSITFLNSMKNLGYATVNYDITGKIEFQKTDEGWANVWLDELTTYKKFEYKQDDKKDIYTYMSGISGDSISDEAVLAYFGVNLPEFAKNSLKDAYEEYQDTVSGCLSYKENSSVKNLHKGYKFKSILNNGGNADKENSRWVLEKDVVLKLDETSWNIIYSENYTKDVNAKLSLEITPTYELKTEYIYSIIDLILTKYNLSDKESNKQHHYSVIMQMMINPKELENDSESQKETTTESLSEDVTIETEPSEDDLEETLVNKIGSKYVTFNIKLDQVVGVDDVSNSKIFRFEEIEGDQELKNYFKELKAKYQNERNTNIKIFKEKNDKGREIPKKFNVTDMEEFKTDLKNISNICKTIEEIKDNIERVNLEKSNLEAQLVQDENNLISIRQQIADLENDDIDSNSEIKEKSVENTTFIESNTYENSEQNVFDSDINSLNEQAKILEEKIQATKKKIDEYKKELENLNKQLEDKENELLKYEIEFKEKFNNKYSIKFKWNNKVLDFDEIKNSYNQCDAICAEIDKGIKAYNDFLPDADKETSSDKFIETAKELNSNENINRIFDDLDFALTKESVQTTFDDKTGAKVQGREITIGSEQEKFYLKEIKENGKVVKLEKITNGDKNNKYDYMSYAFLSENKGNFFANINKIANLVNIEKKDEIIKDPNEDIINDYVYKELKLITDNSFATKKYSDFISYSDLIYSSICKDYNNINENAEIVSNGKEICDITKDDVQNAVKSYFCSKGVYQLDEYDSQNNFVKTHMMTPTVDFAVKTVVEKEDFTESTTEDIYKDSNEIISNSYGNILKYAEEIKTSFYNIESIANDFLSKQGVADSGKFVDGLDTTSDYYIYTIGKSYSDDMLKYLKETEQYVKALNKYKSDIKNVKNLEIIKCDDNYYKTLCNEKISQLSKINKLFDKILATTDETIRNNLIEEYKSVDWLILDDVKVTKDFSIKRVVSVEKVKTIYQKIQWNTALVREFTDNESTDTNKNEGNTYQSNQSNITDEPYEFYQMNSNYCVATASEDAFLVPIGAQVHSITSARAINKKINDELRKLNMSNVDNVAYGSVSDYSGSGGLYDIILFSGDNKWFMIYLKQGKLDTTGKPTYDLNNIFGKSGIFGIDATGKNMDSDGKIVSADANLGADFMNSADSHFLEYDRTNITGSTQFYSTTLQNGYKPYAIDISKDKGVIYPDTGAGSIAGSFFKSWASSKGYVILIGYTEDDMKLAPNQDFGLETETGADSDNQEESYKAEKREITDLDIYDANLYVLSYDVKAPENPISEKEETGKHISLPVGGTNLLDGGVILEGPFGERAMPAIRFFAMLKYAIIAIVYSLAIIYCIYLGVRYSKAKDEEEHKKAKNHIAWFLIAFIGTHILIVFITLASQTLLEWEESVTVITQETETEIESETETKD